MISCGTASDGGETQLPSSDNEAPTADFTYSPSNPTTEDQVTFDGSNSNDTDGSIEEYRWDFNGDGSNEVATSSASTTHQFPRAGDVDVQLEVVDGDGASAEKTQTISVTAGNQSPTAKFTYSPSEPPVGETVTFDGSNSTDPDGSIIGYKWDFNGNGTFGEMYETSTISHSYSSPGDYEATLKVIDDDDSTAVSTKTVQVIGNKAPTADFSFSPSNPFVGEAITFDGSESVDQDGTIIQYRWDIDGDGNVDAEMQTATYTTAYSKAGNFDVSLQVFDDEGASSTTTKTVTVDSGDPSASFMYSPSTPNVGETVTFDGSGSSDPNGTIVAYRWDLNGDGAFGDYKQTAEINHTYSNSGEYEVTLEVFDEDDNSDLVTKTIKVGN